MGNNFVQKSVLPTWPCKFQIGVVQEQIGCVRRGETTVTDLQFPCGPHHVLKGDRINGNHSVQHVAKLLLVHLEEYVRNDWKCRREIRLLPFHRRTLSAPVFFEPFGRFDWCCEFSEDSIVGGYVA